MYLSLKYVVRFVMASYSNAWMQYIPYSGLFMRELFHKFAYSNFSRGKIFTNHQEHLVINISSKHFKGKIFHKWQLICEVHETLLNKQAIQYSYVYVIRSYVVHTHVRKKLQIKMPTHLIFKLEMLKNLFNIFNNIPWILSVYTCDSEHAWILIL